MERNISDPSDWRKREAATMAFGSILEGKNGTPSRFESISFFPISKQMMVQRGG